ncbi:20763_t:CDS:2, partial [Entrophospora sp. SA101]
TLRKGAIDLDKIDDKLYLFPTFNIEMKIATLPIGYCTNYLPSFDSCCDYENCEIANDYNDDNCTLICVFRKFRLESLDNTSVL